jgi:predicted  nucleic acid-binding Zn-ribbon protein
VKIEATVKQIRALLQLAELNAGPDPPSPEAREAAQRGVPPPLLERCLSLIDAGRTPAVVAIERGACAGCHLRLPTMLEQQAAHSLAVHTCPHCRRMLYAPALILERSHLHEAMSPAHAERAAGKRP